MLVEMSNILAEVKKRPATCYHNQAESGVDRATESIDQITVRLLSE